MGKDTHSETIGERIAQIRGKKSQTAFAEELGLHKNSLGHYERGNRVPDADVLQQLVAWGYDANWLLTGKGDPHGHNSEGHDSVSTPIERLKELDREFAMIPGYSVQVSAGDGSFPLNEEPRRWLAFRHKYLHVRGLHEKDLVLVFAKGDSMEPTISDNETILIDTSRTKLADGHIYVIRNGDELLVKRVQTLWNDGVLLISDNKEYQPQEIGADQMEGLDVIGKVVWVGKEL